MHQVLFSLCLPTQTPISAFVFERRETLCRQFDCPNDRFQLRLISYSCWQDKSFVEWGRGNKWSHGVWENGGLRAGCYPAPQYSEGLDNNRFINAVSAQLDEKNRWELCLFRSWNTKCLDTLNAITRFFHIEGLLNRTFNLYRAQRIEFANSRSNSRSLLGELFQGPNYH